MALVHILLTSVENVVGISLIQRVICEMDVRTCHILSCWLLVFLSRKPS